MNCSHWRLEIYASSGLIRWRSAGRIDCRRVTPFQNWHRIMMDVRKKYHRSGHSRVIVNIVPRQATLARLLPHARTKQAISNITRLVSNKSFAYEWKTDLRMRPFARKLLRMKSIIVLMVMNHHAAAHITYTVAFRYFRRNWNTYPYSLPQNYPQYILVIPKIGKPGITPGPWKVQGINFE